MAASVRARLRNIATTRGDDFQLVLTRYCLERLLYRLSRSAHGRVFILKGAMLFPLRLGQYHRPTHDLDLLGRGENSVERFEAVFRAVCSQPVEDDGLQFPAEAVRGERIREDQLYGGIRVHGEARLENARIPVQVDVGFGDAVTPAPAEIAYPTLLDLPAPALLAYPWETVVAEKFQAMVALGLTNSRMKDFYDLWVIARHCSFGGPLLGQALRATFERRQTPLPAVPPLALTAAFCEHADKVKQWKAFVSRSRLDASGGSLRDVAGVLREFLMPVAQAAAAGETFPKTWPAAGPWVV
ncbi:MAG TPA: nucleotidyl transferase AbiEii/AbiGii toxin family protein [Gemmataceae bacterium]|nr:nucleotidyl transferase AbiEii/AbiGii toxin family protein [Gemmataceae bacterium]